MVSLTGTGVAIVTPFKKNKEVDFEALKKLIDFIIQEGAQYIVTMGTTGETPVLTKAEKKAIIEFTFLQVQNRVPIIVGIGGNYTDDVIDDLHHFPLEKAAAVLSASPYYNKPSQEGLYQHYKKLAENSPKPIILYNVPARTGRNIEVQTILRLANEVDNIIGIKEASGNMHHCMELLRLRPKNFWVVSGDDALALPQMACGMDGVISVAANAFPAAFSGMIQLCQQQDFSAAKKINDQLIQAYDIMFEENNPAGVKAFLSEMHLLENELRLPLVSISQPLHQAVRDFLKSFLGKNQI